MRQLSALHILHRISITSAFQRRKHPLSSMISRSVSVTPPLQTPKCVHDAMPLVFAVPGVIAKAAMDCEIAPKHMKPLFEAF